MGVVVKTKWQVKSFKKRVEPLFYVSNDVDQTDKYLDTYDIYMALHSILGDKELTDGVQHIGGLWRIYFYDENARLEILSYDNDSITSVLKSMGVNMLGCLKYVRARTL